jgi:RimJ/RimL family protein N-acetyltransferase
VHVALGPVLPEYAERMFDWVRDPEVSGNLGLRREATLERTRQWIESAAADDSMRAFAILAEDRHAGNVVLDQIDWYLSKARFSIYLGEPAARGRGIGLAATRLALRVAFEELGLYKVWLTVHTANHRAIQTYLNAGFRKEGLLRGEFLIGGARLDAWYMGVVRGES